jgi:hypothetical protein
MHRRIHSVLAASAVTALLFGSTVAGAGVSGAIFTTDQDGSFVNANVYEQPEDVYLDGGPRANAPCTAAGLPDDDYYFQVTDPSGQDLLSSDPVTDRLVHVGGGVIRANLGSHATGVGKCGSVTVRLCPFNPTTNEGEEYKVWMTSTTAYWAKGGFSRNESETDNFKVTGADLCPAGGGD